MKSCNNETITNTNGHILGYGFVMFENHDDAAVAVEALTRLGTQAAFAKITRSQSTADWSSSRKAAMDPTNLYIATLPQEVDELILTSLLHFCLEGVGEVLISIVQIANFNNNVKKNTHILQ